MTGVVVVIDLTGVIAGIDLTGVVVVIDLTGVIAGIDLTGVVVVIDLTGVIAGIAFTGIIVTDLAGAITIDLTGATEATEHFDSPPPLLPLFPLSFCLSKKEGMGVTTDVTCMWVLLASTADRNTSWKATNNTSSLNNRICFLSVLRLMS